MSAGVESRVRAAAILGRVLRDGGYSNVLIRTETAGLDERDRRFVQWLVFTALRRLTVVDETIVASSSRDIGAIDPPVLDALRVAATELLFGESPAYATVDSSVEAIRTAGHDRAAGFANAVLRRIAGKPRDDRALTAGVGWPDWIRDRLVAARGVADADAFLSASVLEPGVGVWAPGPLPEPEIAPVEGIDPSAGYAEAGATVARAADEGRVLVMDPASVAVARAVGAKPGERILDLAAAPGGKTAVLASALRGRGLLVAADSHRRRLGSARRRLRRLGLDAAWVIQDGRQPAFVPRAFDAVLLDAPCTGLGTLRRRPEIAHRLRPEAPRMLGILQEELLESAMSLTRPGGRVVYSVCTLFPEETVDRVEALPASPPDDLPGERWGNGLLLAPHLTGTDGMFVSVITVE